MPGIFERKKIGAKIRARRAEGQLSQSDLATRASIRQARLSSIETGQVVARSDEMRRLNLALAARRRELEAIAETLARLERESAPGEPSA